MIVRRGRKEDVDVTVAVCVYRENRKAPCPTVDITRSVKLGDEPPSFSCHAILSSPHDAAIEAITIRAARISGIDHRGGSIEIGRDADFAITDGDLLHYMTLVRWTIVNGRVVYDKQKDTLFDHIKPDGNPDAPRPTTFGPAI